VPLERDEGPTWVPPPPQPKRPPPVIARPVVRQKVPVEVKKDAPPPAKVEKQKMIPI